MTPRQLFRRLDKLVDNLVRGIPPARDDADAERRSGLTDEELHTFAGLISRSGILDLDWSVGIDDEDYEACTERLTGSEREMLDQLVKTSKERLAMGPTKSDTR